MLSTIKAKEEVRDYDKGLDVVNKLEVKMYNYKEDFGGEKDKVGVIAETIPEEIRVDMGGNTGVDLYGLIGLLINAVKQLNAKIDLLEEKCHNQ